MSLTSTKNSTTVSAPSKVFLLGEYAVLGGSPAVLAAIEPRFRLRKGATSGFSTSFHPESPAGLWLKGKKTEPFQWRDPWQGQGGFGGSTAEFISVCFAYGVRDPLEAFDSYRELTGERPSGADLMVQWTGGAGVWSPREKKFNDLSSSISSLNLALVSAAHQKDRKVKTHDDLEKNRSRLGPSDFRKLEAQVLEAIPFLIPGQEEQLGRCLTGYADTLQGLGLETEAAFSDRIALLSIPGVWGVKGCGAGLSDALIVGYRDTESLREIQEILFLRDLKFISSRLMLSSGVKWDD